MARQPVGITAAYIGGGAILLAAVITAFGPGLWADREPSLSTSAGSATSSSPNLETGAAGKSQFQDKCDGAVQTLNIAAGQQYELNPEGRCSMLLRITQGEVYDNSGLPLSGAFDPDYWGFFGTPPRMVRSGPGGASIDFRYCLSANMDRSGDSSGCQTTEPTVLPTAD